MVEARNVAIAKKLIPDLKHFWSRNEISFLVYILNKFKPKSGGKEVSVPLKDGLLFATLKLYYKTEIGVV